MEGMQRIHCTLNPVAGRETSNNARNKMWAIVLGIWKSLPLHQEGKIMQGNYKYELHSLLSDLFSGYEKALSIFQSSVKPHENL